MERHRFLDPCEWKYATGHSNGTDIPQLYAFVYSRFSPSLNNSENNTSLKPRQNISNHVIYHYGRFARRTTSHLVWMTNIEEKAVC